MISKYLKALIESNNRIIIPDFGAFMIQDTPEGKQISFNDFLKFNDGLLVNQIIKTDKISKNQASDQVKEFISAVEKNFSQNKPYFMEGIGQLTRDSSGNIKFDKKLTDTPSTSPTDTKPTIVIDEEAKKSPEPKKETPEPIKKEEEKPVKNETKAPQEPIKPNPAPIIEKKEEPVIKETPKPSIPPKINKPIPKQPMNNKPTTPTKSMSNDNTMNIVIIVAAIVIIIGGGTWAFFKFDIGSKFGKKEPIAVQAPAPVIDTVAVDTVTPEPEPMVVEEPIDENIKKYYLIAGSFKVVAYASTFNKKLIDNGFDSEIVIRNNGFHCVSLKTYYTWEEVVQGWREQRNNYPGVWILIK